MCFIDIIISLGASIIIYADWPLDILYRLQSWLAAAAAQRWVNPKSGFALKARVGQKEKGVQNWGYTYV